MSLPLPTSASAGPAPAHAGKTPSEPAASALAAALAASAPPQPHPQPQPKPQPQPPPPPLPTAASRNHPAFVNKLRSMVDDPSTDDLIRWSPSGKSIFICHPPRFAEHLLPRYFLHRKLSSFERQLNMYGFHKVPHLQAGALAPTWGGPSTTQPLASSTAAGSIPSTRTPAEQQQDDRAINEFHAKGAYTSEDLELREFMHEHFQRDHPEWLNLVVRKKPTPHNGSTGKKRTKDNGDDDDLPAPIIEEPAERPNVPPPLPWGQPAGLIGAPPPPGMSNAVAPYYGHSPSDVPLPLVEAILATHGLHSTPAAIAAVTATLTGNNPHVAAANLTTPNAVPPPPAPSPNSAPTPAPRPDTRATSISSTPQARASSPNRPSSATPSAPGSSGFNLSAAGTMPNTYPFANPLGSVSNGIPSQSGPWNMNVNLGAVLQTLQTTQSDLVREIAHLRTAQHRLWQDSQEEKKRYRKHQDVLQRILRFLGGVFGATPALLPPESELDPDTTQGEKDETESPHAPKRPRTSAFDGHDYDHAKSPEGANIEELLDSVADGLSPGSAPLRKSLSDATPSGAGTVFSPARRGLMIEGPSGWKKESPGAVVPSPGELLPGPRFTRLGSPTPSTTSPMAEDEWRHSQDRRQGQGRACSAAPAAPGGQMLRATPPRRPSKPAALSKDQMASWIHQLIQQPGSPAPSSPLPSSAHLDDALNSTDAQAQALQQSIAALAQSLHNGDPSQGQTPALSIHTGAGGSAAPAAVGAYAPTSTAPAPAPALAEPTADDYLLFHQFLQPDRDGEVPSPLPARESAAATPGVAATEPTDTNSPSQQTVPSPPPASTNLEPADAFAFSPFDAVQVPPSPAAQNA